MTSLNAATTQLIVNISAFYPAYLPARFRVTCLPRLLRAFTLLYLFAFSNFYAYAMREQQARYHLYQPLRTRTAHFFYLPFLLSCWRVFHISCCSAGQLLLRVRITAYGLCAHRNSTVRQT